MSHRLDIAPLPIEGMWCVACSCGWHASSATLALLDWNIEGHRITVDALRQVAEADA